LFIQLLLLLDAVDVVVGGAIIDSGNARMAAKTISWR
jgi:hypothetical protein